MDIQTIIDAIKDYGATIVSGISLGGIAAVAGVIIKAKKAIDETKEKMGTALKKKDEAEKLKDAKYDELMSVIKQQNEKIDTVTQELTRVKNVKSNTNSKEKV